MATGCLLALAGCGRQSTLSPRSPQTYDIRTLWWWMLGAAVVVFLGAAALLGLAWIRRGTPGLPFFGQRESVPQMMVVLFGVAIPLVVLCGYLTFSRAGALGAAVALISFLALAPKRLPKLATVISDQKISDATPRTASGATVPLGLAAFAASLRA